MAIPLARLVLTVHIHVIVIVRVLLLSNRLRRRGRWCHRLTGRLRCRLRLKCWRWRVCLWRDRLVCLMCLCGCLLGRMLLVTRRMRRLSMRRRTSRVSLLVRLLVRRLLVCLLVALRVALRMRRRQTLGMGLRMDLWQRMVVLVRGRMGHQVGIVRLVNLLWLLLLDRLLLRERLNLLCYRVALVRLMARVVRVVLMVLVVLVCLVVLVGLMVLVGLVSLVCLMRLVRLLLQRLNRLDRLRDWLLDMLLNLLRHGLVHGLLKIGHLSRLLLQLPLRTSPLAAGGHGGRAMCLGRGVPRSPIGDVLDAVDSRNGRRRGAREEVMRVMGLRRLLGRVLLRLIGRLVLLGCRRGFGRRGGM